MAPPINDHSLLHHLIRPARGGALALVIVFGILLTVAASAGLPGLPLGLILLSWFFKYAYILFDHVVRGFDEPPTLDISMVNPVNEQRPLLQLLIVVIVAVMVKYVAIHSPAGAVGLAALFLAAGPASVAILGLEGNPIKAVNPVALIHMIAGLGGRYALLLGVIAATALLLQVVFRLHIWNILDITIGMFAILAVFSALGGSLYDRRHELGLEAWHSPEKVEAKKRAAEDATNAAVVTEAYGLVRVGSHVKAWEMLQTWLTERGNEFADYRWLIERCATWNDRRYASRLTEDYVERLLASRRTGEALDAVVARCRQDADFRPKTAASTLEIAELAARGGGASKLARHLLRDFGERFEGDAHVAEAQDLARHLRE
jgi:hypothetical protein